MSTILCVLDIDDTLIRLLMVYYRPSIYDGYKGRFAPIAPGTHLQSLTGTPFSDVERWSELVAADGNATYVVGEVTVIQERPLIVRYNDVSTVWWIQGQVSLDKLFDYFKASSFYRVALWTLGTFHHAQRIRIVLTRLFKLPRDFFLFVWDMKDVVDVDYTKDLNQVYEMFPDYRSHNTFLIDDNVDNIYHSRNYCNGMLMPAFGTPGIMSRVVVTLTHLQDVYMKHKDDPVWMSRPLLTKEKIQVISQMNQTFDDDTIARIARDVIDAIISDLKTTNSDSEQVGE
jgi:hypothetical protein